MLNKAEIDFATSILNNGVRIKKKGVLSDRLHREWGIGRPVLKRNEYSYNHKDIEIIQVRLEQSGITSRKEIVFGGSRNEIAQQMVGEKVGAKAVFPEPICFKVVKPGASINGQDILPTGVGHLQFNFSDIDVIKAKALVIVENLETFKCLRDVKFSFPLEGYLFVWRGGPESKLSVPNSQVHAKQLAATNQLSVGFFGDFDLKGLIMAYELAGDFCVLPILSELLNANLKGNSEDYRNQWEEYRVKKASLDQIRSFKPYLNLLSDKRESYTQERISAAELSHTIINVSPL